MKKVYLIPETIVRKSLLMQTYMLDISPNTSANPNADVESKERYEEEEKGFGQYQW